MTVPDTLHTGLQNRTGTGYFGTRAGTQNKACLSTELRPPLLVFPPRAGTGVNCSHDGVRWQDWSTLKDHSLWHYLWKGAKTNCVRKKGTLFTRHLTRWKDTLRLLLLRWNHKINGSYTHQPSYQSKWIKRPPLHSALDSLWLPSNEITS